MAARRRRWLVEAVGDGDAPVWTYVGDRPARFWLRRMLHDTAVHHADLAGRDPAIPADVAADALDELLEAVTGAAALKPAWGELRGDGQTLLLRPSDVPTAWLITRGPDGATWRRGGVDADVAVDASVRDLLLTMTRRLSPDDPNVTVGGDRAVLDHWLTRTAL